jgi:hypothetical protein
MNTDLGTLATASKVPATKALPVIWSPNQGKAIK